MKKSLKLIFANKLLFIGVGLFVGNLFSFDVENGCSSFLRNGILVSDKCIEQYYYLYRGENLTALVVGSLLITFGILNILKKD